MVFLLADGIGVYSRGGQRGRPKPALYQIDRHLLFNVGFPKATVHTLFFRRERYIVGHTQVMLDMPPPYERDMA